MQRLCTPLATIFVEKNVGVVLDPFELPHERNFWYLEKNGILKFFKQLHHPEPVIQPNILLINWPYRKLSPICVMVPDRWKLLSLFGHAHALKNFCFSTCRKTKQNLQSKNSWIHLSEWCFVYYNRKSAPDKFSSSKG